ncbi:MAG: Asp-tRNA(Asn)/Glu-tRNA(Gln) amidotransferase subunit GatB [bacterium]
MEYESVIGLEIHIQLGTASKMFCSCSNQGEYQPPNTTVCPICLGHPGTLPVVNKKAFEYGAKLALAINCQINQKSKFDRKHYFYPDLPKGYQISQYDQPLAADGHVLARTDSGEVRIRIERLHLEEDAAKNFHVDNKTLVDFNRSGSPLAEIVTKPDFKTPEQAVAFLKQLRLIVRYLEVSDGDMEKGHLRCDVNVSLRPKGDSKLYAKTEIKNVNSFRSVEKALEYEIKEQTRLWEEGNPPKSLRTLGWREGDKQTVVQRVKEEAMDYRYFPEPDLPPLVITDSELTKWKNDLPELPYDKYRRLLEEYQLKPMAARQLVDDKDLSAYFEQSCGELKGLVDNEEAEPLAKTVYGWLTSELIKLCNVQGIGVKECKINPAQFALFLSFIVRRQINSTNGQILLKEMFDTGNDPESILSEKDLEMVKDLDLDELAKGIVNTHPKEAESYKAGKKNLFQFFVGLLMKETKGKADPKAVREAIEKVLGE